MPLVKKIAYITACVLVSLVILLLIFLMAAPAMFDSRDTVSNPAPRVIF